MNVVKRVVTISLALAIISLVPNASLACTSFVLKAEDGAVVYGRTMEWGTFDHNSRLVIVPRGHHVRPLE